MLVSGVYAAWIGEWDYHGSYVTGVQVNLRNLLTGRSARTPSADQLLISACPGSEGHSLAFGSISLLLSPGEVAAWQVQTCVYRQPPPAPPEVTSTVQAINNEMRTTVTLDAAPLPALAGLQLQQCLAGCLPPGATFAWWSHDGVWRVARVG